MILLGGSTEITGFDTSDLSGNRVDLASVPMMPVEGDYRLERPFGYPAMIT